MNRSPGQMNGRFESVQPEGGPRELELSARHSRGYTVAAGRLGN